MQRVRDFACVTNNLGGGYGPVGVRPEKLAANSKLGTPGTCRFSF